MLRTKVTPNQVSVIGILFATGGAWAFVEAWRAPWLYLLGALGGIAIPGVAGHDPVGDIGGAKLTDLEPHQRDLVAP